MEADAGKSGSDRAKSHRAMMRAAWVIETRRFDGDVVRALSDDGGRGVALFAEGLAAAAKGERERAEKALAAMGKEPEGGHHHGGSGMYGMRVKKKIVAGNKARKKLKASEVARVLTEPR